VVGGCVCPGTLAELIRHGLTALGETIGSQEEIGLTPENTSVAIVGENQSFKLIEGSELKPYVHAPASQSPFHFLLFEVLTPNPSFHFFRSAAAASPSKLDSVDEEGQAQTMES